MVESNCEFAMQAPQEILVPRRSLFEADYDMIVIREESPTPVELARNCLLAQKRCRGRDQVLRWN